MKSTLFRKAPSNTGRKILLRACPRCRGDLFHDDYEDEFACLQCGRRADPAMIVMKTPEPEVVTPLAA